MTNPLLTSCRLGVSGFFLFRGSQVKSSHKKSFDFLYFMSFRPGKSGADTEVGAELRNHLFLCFFASHPILPKDDPKNGVRKIMDRLFPSILLVLTLSACFDQPQPSSGGLPIRDPSHTDGDGDVRTAKAQPLDNQDNLNVEKTHPNDLGKVEKAARSATDSQTSIATSQDKGSPQETSMTAATATSTGTSTDGGTTSAPTPPVCKPPKRLINGSCVCVSGNYFCDPSKS